MCLKEWVWGSALSVRAGIRYSSVNEENEGDGTESSLMRVERGLQESEDKRKKETSSFKYISIKLFSINKIKLKAKAAAL